MFWRLAVALVVLAASCSAPEPPESWSVQRVSPPDESSDGNDELCDTVRSFALGSLAESPTLGTTVDELARVGAMAGATAALPLLGELQAAISASPEPPDQAAFVQRHDLLVSAGTTIDVATAASCELPLFSALYATTGFPDCHFELEIPVAAYTRLGEAGTCSMEGRPSFLPCWSRDGEHLPVDCVSEEVLQADGDRWLPAGPPRSVSIDRSGIDTDGPVLVTTTNASECRALLGLFEGDDLPNGVISDFDRLRDAAADLDADTRDLIDQFINANVDPPSFDVFEVLVASLDAATAGACGFPLVSAWVSILEPITESPCWLETGDPYPAYQQADCR